MTIILGFVDPVGINNKYSKRLSLSPQNLQTFPGANEVLWFGISQEWRSKIMLLKCY